MSAILIRFSDSPAIDLVRLSSLILLILKYTISQMLVALKVHWFLKGSVLQVTAVRAKNLTRNAKYLLYCSMLVWPGGAKLGLGISKWLDISPDQVSAQLNISWTY